MCGSSWSNLQPNSFFFLALPQKSRFLLLIRIARQIKPSFTQCLFFFLLQQTLAPAPVSGFRDWLRSSHSFIKCFDVLFSIIHPQRHHLSYETGEPSQREAGKLTNLQMKMPIWEFLSYLSPGSTEQTFERGKAWDRFYLTSQRESYLKQQLVLEEQASAITYITPAITNALATDEVLNGVSRKKLGSIFDNDPFGGFEKISSPFPT